MCGIFGAVTQKEIKISNNILPHRGPDDWGVDALVNSSKHITLFQSRLSIIGIGDQGHQPYGKYPEYKLIFNGEIYNFQSIKKMLIKEFNIDFISETDTEVLYESLINYGIDNTLTKINGIFAFAFLNLNNNTLEIARDHLGVKPLYYYQNESLFLFSSEIKSFFTLSLVKPHLNKESLGEYLANGWVYEPDTMFKDIFKLESAHYLTYNILSSKSIKTRYWALSQKKRRKINLAKSIHNQTISDVAIGNYLSGGIDSSIIAITLHDLDVLNINMDFADEETEMVNLLKKNFSLNVKTFQPIGFPLSLYTKLIYYLDEPIADPAIIPAFLLAKASKDMKRSVMLSGMGGDEIDGGYTRHSIINNLKIFRLVKLIPSWVKYIMSRSQKRDFVRLKNFFRNPSPENYFALTSYLSKKEIDEMISFQWYERYTKKIACFTQGFSCLKQFLILDFKGFLSSHNLIYMDKASMAASVEVRVPLLDHELVSDFFQEYEKNIGKKRLKLYAKNLLGVFFKENKKQGFRYPINDWLLKEIDWVEICDFFEQKKLLNTKMIKAYLQELEKGNDTEMKLWIIYTLYLWLISFKVNI